MAININNYEAYFLDYHEGNLSKDDLHALMAFLDSNPDLKAEFDNYEKIEFLPDPEVSFTGKDSLKKNASEHLDFDDDMLIAYLEGDLSDEEKESARKLIKADKQASIHYGALKNSVSQADLSIRFPGKEKLKKKERILVLPARIYTYAAAAVIILLIGFSYSYFFDGINTEKTERISLAKAETYNIKAIKTVAVHTAIQERDYIAPRSSILEREHVEISKLKYGEAKPIDISYAHMPDRYLAQYRLEEYPAYGFENTAEALAQAKQPANKSLAGRVISGFFNKVSSPFASNKNSKEKSPSNFSIWDIAEFGVKSVNVLGDHEYTLVKKYNENGNVKGVRILEE